MIGVYRETGLGLRDVIGGDQIQPFFVQFLNGIVFQALAFCREANDFEFQFVLFFISFDLLENVDRGI